MTGQEAGGSLAEAVVQWFSDPAARQDPHPLYDRLRSEDPVHYNPILRAWVLTRYRDVEFIYRDAPVVRSPLFGDRSFMLDENGELTPTFRLDAGTQRWREGDDLRRMRSLVSQVMNVHAFRGWRERMVAIVGATVERLRERTEMDVVADFAFELPMQMMCSVLGAPISHATDYHRWTNDWFAAVQFADPEIRARGDVAALAFEAEFTAILAKKRADPDDSMISMLIRAREQEQRHSDEELIALPCAMIAAGTETTGSLVGNALLHLLRNPEELALVRADLEAIPEVVEETMRYEPSAPLTARYPLEDFEVNGKQINAGDTLWLLLQATGRSPDTFPEPNRFWVKRPDKRHLGFALGPHFCCGAQLARIEAELMLGALIMEFPDMELATDRVTWRSSIAVRGLESLPVIWN